MSLSATKAMVNDSRPLSMPTDYCMSNGSPYGNDDIIQRQITSVISENMICIGMIVIVVLVTSVIVYYIGKILYKIVKDYMDHIGRNKKVNVEEHDEDDDEDEIFQEPLPLPAVPQVQAVKKRMDDIERQYKGYNEAISKRRDGSEAIMDTRILSRAEDNYTYKRGKPKPNIRV